MKNTIPVNTRKPVKKSVGERGPDRKPRKKPLIFTAGRKTREELGLPPVVNTTVQVEKEVIDLCREKYGSLANALRYASKRKRVGKPVKR